MRPHAGIRPRQLLAQFRPGSTTARNAPVRQTPRATAARASAASAKTGCSSAFRRRRRNRRSSSRSFCQQAFDAHEGHLKSLAKDLLRPLGAGQTKPSRSITATNFHDEVEKRTASSFERDPFAHGREKSDFERNSERKSIRELVKPEDRGVNLEAKFDVALPLDGIEGAEIAGEDNVWVHLRVASLSFARKDDGRERHFVCLLPPQSLRIARVLGRGVPVGVSTAFARSSASRAVSIDGNGLTDSGVATGGAGVGGARGLGSGGVGGHCLDGTWVARCPNFGDTMTCVRSTALLVLRRATARF